MTPSWQAYAGSTARTNNANYALINRNRGPYAEGAFRYVYDGRCVVVHSPGGLSGRLV
jgi:hypothetical protein